VHSIRGDIWNILDVITTLESKGEGPRERERRDKNFDRLAYMKNRNTTDSDAKKVINLSNHEPNSDKRSILKKVLGFFVVPSTIPVENIVFIIKDSIKNLNKEDKYAIRQDYVLVFRRLKPSKINISNKERESLITSETIIAFWC
jgi:hypothetical protein